MELSWQSNVSALNILQTTELNALNGEYTLSEFYLHLRQFFKSWLKAQHSENEDYGIWSYHFMGNRWGNSGNSVRLYFGGLQDHCRW